MCLYHIQVDGVPQANVSYKHKSTDSKWAVKVNVNDPVDDFHERIPNMAHNVSAYAL